MGINAIIKKCKWIKKNRKIREKTHTQTHGFFRRCIARSAFMKLWRREEDPEGFKRDCWEFCPHFVYLFKSWSSLLLHTSYINKLVSVLFSLCSLRHLIAWAPLTAAHRGVRTHACTSSKAQDLARKKQQSVYTFQPFCEERGRAKSPLRESRRQTSREKADF